MKDPGSSPRPATAGTSVRGWRVVLLLVAVGVCAAYLVANGGQLISDDWTLFSTARSFESALADFSRGWLGFSTGYYRPLASLSLAVDHAIWGTNAYGYHLTNVLLLLLCAASAGRLAGRLSRASGAGVGLATFCVCITHPVAVEPVTWICCRSTLLCGLLSVVGWTAFIAFVQSGKARQLLLVLLAQSAALTAKEDALLFPGIALALAFSLRRWRQLLAGVVATLLPIALYFGVRLAAGVHVPDVGHGGFLDPGRWLEAASRLFADLRLLVVPHSADAPAVSLISNALCVAGLLLLAVRTPLVNLGRGMPRVVFGLGVSLLLAMPAIVTLAHGTRLLFQPMLLVAVFVGLLADQRPTRPRGAVPYVGALVLGCGLVVLMVPTLMRWRGAGGLCTRIARGLHQLHKRVPADEVFIFVDPPASRAGVPVFSEGLDAVLRPPFTRVARPVISAYRDLAIELITRADQDPTAGSPKRILHWDSERGLLAAPAPPIGPVVVTEWTRGEFEVRRGVDERSAVLQLPRLGLSALAVQRLEVLLTGGAAADACTLTVERSPGGFVSTKLALGPAVPTADGGSNLWIPIRDLAELRDAIRLDRIELRLSGPRPEDVAGVRVLRDLPAFGIRAALARRTPGSDSLCLSVRLLQAARRPWSSFRIEIFHIRNRLAALTVPATSLAREGDDLVFTAVRTVDELARLGVTPHTRLFVRVEGFTGPCDPAHLRARSQWVLVERD